SDDSLRHLAHLHTPPPFFLPHRRPPSSPLFPYTTLFRSDLIPLLFSPLMDGSSDENERILKSIRILRKAEQTILPEDIRKMEARSEEHTSELQSRFDLVCRLLLEKKKEQNAYNTT